MKAQLVLVGAAALLIGCESVPRGAVVAFNLKDCPNGWGEYTQAYGRFIRGVDRSKQRIDPDGERAVNSIQEDALQRHQHSRRYRIGGNEAGGGRNMEDNEPNNTLVVGDPIGARVAEETRPKNVALLYCQKWAAN